MLNINLGSSLNSVIINIFHAGVIPTTWRIDFELLRLDTLHAGAQISLQGLGLLLHLESVVFDLFESVIVALDCGWRIYFRIYLFLAHQACVHLEVVTLLRIAWHRPIVVAILRGLVLLDLGFRDRGRNSWYSENVWGVSRGLLIGLSFALARCQGLVRLSLHLIEDLQIVDLLINTTVWVFEYQLLLVFLNLSFIIIRDALGSVLEINIIHMLLLQILRHLPRNSSLIWSEWLQEPIWCRNRLWVNLHKRLIL